MPGLSVRLRWVRTSGPVSLACGKGNAAAAGLQATVTGSLAPSAPTITSPSFLVAGTVDTVYPTTTFTATGTAPITWSVTAGTLPAGMTFSTAGVLAGTPTATSSGSITFTATNAYGSDSRALTLTVDVAPSSDLANVSATITPLQGARNGVPIQINSWSLLSSVTNFAGQWAHYLGAIPGADEGAVVYMWTGPNNWRCLQIAGKMGPVLTHYSDGTTFFTDSSKTTQQTGTAPRILDLAPLAFNISATESGSSINWIAGDHASTKSTLNNVQVHYTVPVFIFNSVPVATLSRAVDAVKQWRLFGVYTDSDKGPENGTTQAPAQVALPTNGFTGGGYSPENPPPTPSDAIYYEGLFLGGQAGDAWTGRSLFEANEAALLDRAINNTLPSDLTTYIWRLMSQSLNLARVPMYCVWNDLTHRINDPQKGARPLRWSTVNSGGHYGIKEAYALNSGASPSLPVITHPWSGTSYMYEITGCPVFASISSGVLAFQISSEYAWLLKILRNYSGYVPASNDSSVDRAEYWAYGRISKLLSELPSSGRVPGAFSSAELDTMLTEMAAVPISGIVDRMVRRKAQTTTGTSVKSTLVYIDQLMNFPSLTVCEHNNNPDLPFNEQGGACFSNLMYLYAFENSVILATSGRTDFVNYLGEILTCFERFVYAFGRGNPYATTNFSVGPQVTETNKGSAYSLQSIDDIRAYRQAYGSRGYVTDYPAIFSASFDNKTLICQIRLLRFIAIAAQKGKLPAAWQARAQSLRDQLLAGCAAVTNSADPTSYGNYFGLPPSLENQMQ